MDQALAALGLPQEGGDALLGQFPSLQDLVQEISIESGPKVGTAPKRRGRPPKPKPEPVAAPPKRRGRPPKARVDEVAATEVVAVRKRRGRPPKPRPEPAEAAPKRAYRKRKKNAFNQPRGKGVPSSPPAPTPVDPLLPEVAKYMRSEHVLRLPIHRELDELVRELRLDGVQERALSYALMRERMRSLRRTGMSMIEARWRIRQEFDGYVIPKADS
jgi:hypothetical protein